MQVVKSKSINDNDVLWKFMPVHRIMDLLAYSRFHSSKTKYMSDKFEGRSIVDQIRLCYKTQEFFGDDKKKNDLYSVLKFLKDHEELVKFHIREHFECEYSDKRVANLIYFICQTLGSQFSDDIAHEVSVGCRSDLDYVGLCELVEKVIDEAEGPKFTEHHLTRMLSNLQNHTYVSSWSWNSVINMLMWEGYARELYGVAIKSTCKKVQLSLEKTPGHTSCKAYIQEIEYKDEPNSIIRKGFDEDLNPIKVFDDNSPKISQFDRFARNSLRYKKLAYRSEEEVRVIIVDSDNLVDDENIYIPINKRFIDEIHLNPRLSKSKAEDYAKLINKLAATSFRQSFRILHDEEILFA